MPVVWLRRDDAMLDLDCGIWDEVCIPNLADQFVKKRGDSGREGIHGYLKIAFTGDNSKYLTMMTKKADRHLCASAEFSGDLYHFAALKRTVVSTSYMDQVSISLLLSFLHNVCLQHGVPEWNYSHILGY